MMIFAYKLATYLSSGDDKLLHNNCHVLKLLLPAESNYIV